MKGDKWRKPPYFRVLPTTSGILGTSILWRSLTHSSADWNLMEADIDQYRKNGSTRLYAKKMIHAVQVLTVKGNDTNGQRS